MKNDFGRMFLEWSLVWEWSSASYLHSPSACTYSHVLKVGECHMTGECDALGCSSSSSG